MLTWLLTSFLVGVFAADFCDFSVHTCYAVRRCLSYAAVKNQLFRNQSEISTVQLTYGHFAEQVQKASSAAQSC